MDMWTERGRGFFWHGGLWRKSRFWDMDMRERETISWITECYRGSSTGYSLKSERKGLYSIFVDGEHRLLCL